MTDRMTAAEYRARTAPKPNKYGARAAYRCEACGAALPQPAKCHACGSDCAIRFDSGAEARRWDELCLLQKAGAITGLNRQVPFPIEINGEAISTYRADFAYHDQDGTYVVEDVKGGDATQTGTFKLKRRAVEAQHGIRIKVVP